MDGGFTRIVGFDEAVQTIESDCQPHGRTEQLPVEEVRGRVVAEAVTAPRAVPHYERAAMDGFAVRSEDTVGASIHSPVALTETTGPVGPGEAAPAHTGSELPAGADAVVMVEQVERREEGLLVSDAVATGENVGPVGEDVEAGDRLFDRGHRFSPVDTGLLQSTGVSSVSVYERPQVSVIPTGEEVVTADPEPGEVVETNGQMVTGLLEQWGATALHRDIVTDDTASLSAALNRDTACDAIVTTGGTSVGTRDMVPAALENRGSISVHGVGIKPGHPFGFGTIDETPVFMLPGYPVSCLVTAVQFLRRGVGTIGGWTPPSMPSVRARLTQKIRSEPGRRGFVRVTLAESERVDSGADTESLPEARPLRVSGAGILSSISFADGWVVVPTEREGIPVGETVTVQLWDWTWRA